MGTKTTLNDLNEYLFQEMDRLTNEDLSVEDLDKEIKRSWKPKHRVVWESVHGRIPKGWIIIFRDNDKTNTKIDNLIPVRRGTHAVLNHTGLYGYSGEFKETAIRIAELKAASFKARKRLDNQTK